MTPAKLLIAASAVSALALCACSSMGPSSTASTAPTGAAGNAAAKVDSSPAPGTDHLLASPTPPASDESAPR